MASSAPWGRQARIPVQYKEINIIDICVYIFRDLIYLPVHFKSERSATVHLLPYDLIHHDNAPQRQLAIKLSGRRDQPPSNVLDIASGSDDKSGFESCENIAGHALNM
jgi:hypothetical protein